MRKRGSKYQSWVNPNVFFTSHDEILNGGIQLSVLTRVREGDVVQLFYGVYAADGKLLVEEYYAVTQHRTMSHALAFGIMQARAAAKRVLRGKR